MTDDELYQKLLNAAFHFLSFRPRSAREIRLYLEKKSNGESPVTVEAVYGRLAELSFVNDQEFTRWWVKARSGRHAMGKSMIFHELLAKGIDPDLIRTVTNEFYEQKGMSEYEQAKSAVQRKLQTLTKLPRREKEKRLFGFLKRRGFSFGTIRRLIDEITGKDYNTSQDEASDDTI